MKIFAIGDVVGSSALAYISERLWKFREQNRIDFVVANGENASEIHGISSSQAKELLQSGVDLITLGNHGFANKEVYNFLCDSNEIIRPANFLPFLPGSGYTVVDACGYRILGINVMGNVFMQQSLACPFDTVEKILRREEGNYDFSILDIHAESTSEKLAIARYFDGKINIIFGTHTHVQTADEQVLPHGSGYITDLGMSGPVDSIIGADTSLVIERMRTQIPCGMRIAGGEVKACGAIFELDTSSRRVTSVRRVSF